MFSKTVLTAFITATILVGVAYGQQQRSRHNHAELGILKPVADDGKRPKIGPHGGSLQTVGSLQMETLVEPSGLRVFVYDAQGRPVDVRQARGTASLKITGDSKRYRYDLFGVAARDNSAKALAAAVDLSRIAGRQVEVDIQVVGLSQDADRRYRFRDVAIVPMTSEQIAAAAIAAQKICPVSNQPLGSMGEPIAIAVGRQTVYVCCESCIGAIKKDPAKYVLNKQPLKISPATEADAKAIALQKICPVMDEPLGSMGKPLKVTGLERDVFLCCKGCLKFLKKDPKKYLVKLPPLPVLAKPNVIKATKADAQLVAAQKICPVMDEPLNAMGGPWKTVVAGRTVYICCPGCAKKLHADPQTYFEKLSSRGVTPAIVK